MSDTTPDSPEIMPCPCCGKSDPDYFDGASGALIRCGGCSLMIHVYHAHGLPGEDGAAEAVRRWNRRAQGVEGLVDQLADALRAAKSYHDHGEVKFLPDDEELIDAALAAYEGEKP